MSGRLTLREALARVGIAKNRFYGRVRDGLLPPAIGSGPTARYDQGQLDAAIAGEDWRKIAPRVQPKTAARDIEQEAKAARERDRLAEVARGKFTLLRQQLSHYYGDFDQLRIKKDEAAYRANVEARIDAAVAADTFDPNLVRELTCPAPYPVAVASLLKRVACFSLQSGFNLATIIADRYSEQVMAYRLGLLVGLAKQDRPFHRPDLIKLAPNDERARFALAAMGQLDWGVASHCERAAALMRAIILTRLGSAP